MVEPNNASRSSNKLNIDEVLNFLNQSINIKTSNLNKLFENKEDLLNLVYQCKNLFTDDQLRKIEHSLAEFNNISMPTPISQNTLINEKEIPLMYYILFLLLAIIITANRNKMKYRF